MPSTRRWRDALCALVVVVAASATGACGNATPTSTSRVTSAASWSSDQPSVPAGCIGSTIQR
jgi:hypothetical protein